MLDWATVQTFTVLSVYNLVDLQKMNKS